MDSVLLYSSLTVLAAAGVFLIWSVAVQGQFNRRRRAINFTILGAGVTLWTAWATLRFVDAGRAADGIMAAIGALFITGIIAAIAFDRDDPTPQPRQSTTKLPVDR